MPASIQLAPGAEDNGFASMLATHLRQNLDDHPDKVAVLERMLGRVALVVEDLRLAVTLRFDGGILTLHDGIAGIPDLTVRAPSELLTKMSLIELRGPLGLPDPEGKVAREVFEASRRGEVVMHGWVQNLPLLLRLTRVMSVN